MSRRLLILLVVSIVAVSWIVLSRNDDSEAAGRINVHIHAYQFGWNYDYTDPEYGIKGSDTLVLPEDVPVRFEITTNDVIHSWWVPDFGGKYDAIPNKVNTTWFKAPSGSYVARCYELCGVQHARMKAVVDVVSRSEYDQFISTRAGDSGTRALGEEEWKGVCLQCHRLGHKYIGPDLNGNPLLADRKGIETLLRNGQGQMPSVGRDWSGHQIDALVAYTKQFAKQGGNG